MARVQGFKITVSDEFKRWAEGLESVEVNEAALARWSLVTDLFFDRTQRAAHVLSGNMKASGRVESRIEGERIIGEVEYGGTIGTEGPVDYVDYELARGGSHDFYNRALQATRRTFTDALAEAAEVMIESQVT